MPSGPQPQVGQVGRVVLADLPLQLVDGTYVVGEAPRFADKISTGSLKYADFRPFEQAWDSVSCAGGYGLRRYSDLLLSNELFFPRVQERKTMYKEGVNVDCREDGIVVLAPALRTPTVTLGGRGPVWMGEYAPSGGAYAGVTQFVIVADNAVYILASTLIPSKILDLPANARIGAVGVFNDRLVIGYGASHTAQYTTDLATLSDVVNSTPAAVYAWAFTSDRAAAYIAGGPAATDWYKVNSSADGGTAYTRSGTGEVVCTTSQSKITALAPGGGIATLFVGRETELGEIDSAALYRTLIPFDSSLSTNCQGMRWFMAGHGIDQRGPVVLFFPREQGLWTYQPSSQTAGTAQNVSPWAKPGIRPPNARGRITAIQGSSRWLYYALRSRNGTSWINVQDARTEAHHTWIQVGNVACNALAITSLFGNPPLLVVANGDGIATATLPLDGDATVDNPGIQYAPSGTLDLPDIDYDFPDEQKLPFVLRVLADNLLAGARQVTVQASFDGGAFQTLGVATTSPVSELSFSASASARRLTLRLILDTYDDATTPQVRAIVLRSSLNPLLYRLWSFKARLPAGLATFGTEDLQNPYTLINTLWDARAAGFPVSFVDRWNDHWTARITQLAEAELLMEPDRIPETVLDVQLLQVARISAGGSAVYGSAVYGSDSYAVGSGASGISAGYGYYTYGAPTSVYGG